MSRIWDFSLQDLGGGVHLIDLGASGKLSDYWSRLAPFINLYAFDPNEQECQRMSSLPSSYLSSTYIPTAIAGETGSYTLHQTKSMYCWSLLPPNLDWLNRFSYADLFQPTGSEVIEAKSLSAVKELEGIKFDAIKLDTQGLEMPILKSIENSLLNDLFFIETEAGFTHNYKEETTIDEVITFLRGNDFLLFDLNIDHRVSRKSPFFDEVTQQQILWCEARWLKDYIVWHQKGRLSVERPEALKALLFCANHGCYDYGFELSGLFKELGLISEKEFIALSSYKTWASFHAPRNLSEYIRKNIKGLCNLIPDRISRYLGETLLDVSKRPSPIKKFFKP